VFFVVVVLVVGCWWFFLFLKKQKKISMLSKRRHILVLDAEEVSPPTILAEDLLRMLHYTNAFALSGSLSLICRRSRHDDLLPPFYCVDKANVWRVDQA
jgi:hypothetical protein